MPTFTNALVLLYGTILAPGWRTVSAALQAMDLADDALAAVRRDLWRSVNYTSAQEADMILIPPAALFSLLEAACYST